MKIILHHTAISKSNLKPQLASVNDFHKAKFNFLSSLGYYIGYHYLIGPTGLITQTRKVGESGAHTYGHNNDIGIALAGNFVIEQPEPPQIYALRDLLKKLVKTHSINKNDIGLHKDYSNTTCPGNLDINFIRSLVSPNVEKELKKEELTKEEKKQQIIKLVKEL